MKLSKLLESLEDLSLKYELWPEKGSDYPRGSYSWVLYVDGEPVSAISNDSDDKNNVIIRHIEAFVPGKNYGLKLVEKLIDNGVSIQTGKENYNSISPSAYKMFSKVDAMADEKGYTSERIGPANNRGKGYDELDDKDVQHFMWKKNR